MSVVKIYLGLFISVAFILWVSNPALAVFLGMAFSFLFKPESTFITRRVSSYPLQVGIVLLGATIQFSLVQKVASSYFIWVSIFVLVTLFLGYLFFKLFRIDKNQAILLTAGSAVCGGTAMAALAPIIKAKPKELVVCMTIIFILNAIAIILFPIVGSWLELSPLEFGAWVSLAVHDTSSVIGAALAFDPEAVKTAATLKLGRTLWLIPLLFVAGSMFRNTHSRKGRRVPLFIVFFILALTIQFFISLSPSVVDILELTSKSCLVVGLFCIGTQATIKDCAGLSIKPIIFSLSLWGCAMAASLLILLFSSL